MRLLQIVPSALRGGCEEYALTIGRAAVKRGWDLGVALSDSAALESLRNDYCDAGASIYRTELPLPERVYPHSKGHVLARMARTLRVLLRYRPEAVHLPLCSPTYALGSLAACALLRKPTLVVFQLALDGEVIAPQARRAYAWVRSRKQQWIAVSQNNRSILAALFGTSLENIDVICNGADAPPFLCDSERQAVRNTIRTELGIPGESSLVVSVGRLSGQKGFDTLIDAAAVVCRARQDAYFMVAGEGSDRPLLEQRLRDHDLQRHFRLLGHRRDVSRLMAASDIFAFPSRGEGQPFALIEAMAAGLPVVASDVSGIGEIIVNGVSGLLTAPEAPLAIAHAITQLLSLPDERVRLGASAASVAASFTGRQMIGKTLRAISGLAQSAGPLELSALTNRAGYDQEAEQFA